MASIPDDIPDLTAIRNALAQSDAVAFRDLAPMVSRVDVLGGNPDGAFTLTLKSGRVATLHVFLDPPDAARDGRQ